MTRPRGFIRQSASAAAWSLAGEQQAFSWRDLMHRAGLADRLSGREQEAFRQTVKAMRDAGELRAVGVVRADHACRPMVLYATAQPEPGGAATADLAHAVCAWAEFK
jgi:hypothetical protein